MDTVIYAVKERRARVQCAIREKRPATNKVQTLISATSIFIISSVKIAQWIYRPDISSNHRIAIIRLHSKRP